MKRKTIIAGNWKMNLSIQEAKTLAKELVETFVQKDNLNLVLIPQNPLLPIISEILTSSCIQLGAQNSSNHLQGPYTGETSPKLLSELECSYCLAGHSERRQIFGETNNIVAKKALALIQVGIIPIICLGETIEERETNKYKEVIFEQLNPIYSTIELSLQNQIVLAYEPIWAIGTAKTSSSEQAEEVHHFMRTQIEVLANLNIAKNTSILYGGSVKSGNAFDLLSKINIDGLLVGGASLKSLEFQEIIKAF